MIDRFLLAGLALAASSLLVAADVPPTPVAPATFVAWEPSGVGRSIKANGLVAVNTTGPVPCPGSRAATPSGRCIVPVARVTSGDGATIDLKGGVREVGSATGPAARLAIGPLDGGRAGAILTSFSGGAHCCESYAVAVRQGAGWRRIEVARTETTDQGPVRQTDFNYGLKGFPTDLDGDGHADFVIGDDAFAYAFTDYADSWTPPVILNVAGDGFADVSRRPAFRRLFAADMAKARQGCVAPSAGRSPNGACAAYAADAARTGRFAAAWPDVIARYDRSSDADGYPRCTTADAAGHCSPEHEVRYANYPAALRAFLIRTGYLQR
ncbi:MAG: hypothetical protein ACRYFW_05540 [Janthinobacterium lividum]